MLLRSRHLARTTASVAVPAMLLVTILVTVSAFTLSPQQRVQRDLGSWEHSVLVTPDEAALTRALAHDLTIAAGDSGATAVATRLESMSVVPDDLPAVFSSGTQRVPTYVEPVSGRAPRTQRLTSGRWPSVPGEVVLSRSLHEALDDRTVFEVFSGAAALRVVGTFEDRYATGSSSIVAAPGTAASWPLSSIEGGFPDFQLDVALFWDGPDARRIVAAAVALPHLADASAESIQASLVERDAVLRSESRTLADRMPMLLRYPTYVVVPLATLMLLMLNRQRLGTYALRLHRSGLRIRPVAGAMGISLAIAACVGALGGGLAGVVLGSALRLLMIPTFLTQPLSPFPWSAVGTQVAGLAATWTGLLAVFGTAAIIRWSTSVAHRSSRHRTHRWFRHWPFARRGGAALTVLLAPALAIGQDPLTRAGTWGGLGLLTGILLVPDLARLAPRLAPDRTGQGLVARRLIASAQPRYAAAITMLACAVALPIGSSVLISSVIRTNEAETVSLVPPGQVLLGMDYAEVPAGLVAAVEDVPGIGPPIRLGILDGELSAKSGSAAGVMVVDDLDDLRRLNQGRLPDRAARTLQSGGIVDWSGAGAAQRLVGFDGRGDAHSSPTLPTASMPMAREYSFQYAGAVLHSTAEDLGLRTTWRAVGYAGLNPSQVDAVVRAGRTAGFAPRAVMFHTDPAPVDLPGAWYASASALALLATGVVWVVVRGQALQMRRYAAGLLSAGITARWTNRVLLWQTSSMLVLSVVAGLIIGALPVLAMAMSPTILFDAPYLLVGTALTLTTVGAGFATLSAVASVRPRDRFGYR